MGTVLINRVFDDVQVNLIPADAEAAAGYVDGRFVTWPALTRRFGRSIPLISITVLGNNARIADDEAGDMNNAQTVNWLRHVTGIRRDRPGPYTEASNMDALAADIRAAGIPRSRYVLWSAHYTGVAHICGPSSCRACETQCDATQYTDLALGESLDETLATREFLTGSSVPAPPPDDWTQKMISNLATLQEGPNSGYTWLVFRLQGLLRGIGKHRNVAPAAGLTIDGAFGPDTLAAVKAVQRTYGLSQDGIVGPATWTALVSG